MTKDISVGPPTEGCIEAAARGLSDSYGTTGLVSVITGLLLLIGMISACPLCTGFEDEAMEKKMQSNSAE